MFFELKIEFYPCLKNILNCEHNEFVYRYYTLHAN